MFKSRFFDSVVVICFALFYVYGLSPSLPWLDSGELIAGSYTHGLSHAPTHPLYSLLSHLLAFVLPGNIAYRYNAVSALLCLATLVVVRRVALRFTAKSPAGELIATLVTLLFGLSPLFFIQALRAEVYALEFLLFTLLLWLAKADSLSPRRWKTFCLLAGLAVSVHPLRSAVFLSCLSFFLWRSPASRELKKQWRSGTPYFLGGLTPYLYHALRDATEPRLGWAHFSTLSDWWVLLTGNVGEQLMSAQSTLLGNVYRIGALVGEQTSALLIVLGIIGIAYMARRSPRLVLALGWLTVITLPMMAVGLMRPFSDGNIHNPDYGAALAMPLLLLYLAGGYGIAQLSGAIPERLAPWLLTVVAVITMGGQIVSANSYGTLRHSYFADLYVNEIEQSLPRGSVLYVQSDGIGIPLTYLQLGEARRSDLTVLLPYQLASPAEYKLRRPFNPSILPTLEVLATVQVAEPFLFTDRHRTYYNFMERLTQFQRAEHLVYVDPTLLSRHPMNSAALERSGLLLKVSGRAAIQSRGVIERRAKILDELATATSALDRYSHADFLAKNQQSLAGWHYDRKEYDAALVASEAALKLRPNDPALQSNVELLRAATKPQPQ